MLTAKNRGHEPARPHSPLSVDDAPSVAPSIDKQPSAVKALLERALAALDAAPAAAVDTESALRRQFRHLGYAGVMIEASGRCIGIDRDGATCIIGDVAVRPLLS